MAKKARKTKKQSRRRSNQGGRTDEQTRILRDIFGDTPVIDAPADLRVFTSANDIRKAKRNNIQECVYSQSCMRLFGSTAVVFFKSIAYIDLPDENGVRKVNRFVLGTAVHRRIVHFDKTGEAHPGGFVLSAPSPSHSLKGKRKENRKWRSSPEGKASSNESNKRYRVRRRSIILGELKPSESKMGKSGVGPLGYVRHGTGMAHFTTKKA